MEGFGIPVLDGARLGMPTIASDCESHLEIQGLHDFNEHVLCLDTLDSREWAAALQAVAGTNRNLADQAAQTRCERIGRYGLFQSKFKAQLQDDLGPSSTELRYRQFSALLMRHRERQGQLTTGCTEIPPEPGVRQ